jgi:hypothetical protein
MYCSSVSITKTVYLYKKTECQTALNDSTDRMEESSGSRLSISRLTINFTEITGHRRGPDTLYINYK